MFKKAIFTAASPNTQIDDVFESVKQLFMPWNWSAGKKTEDFERKLESYTDIKHAIAVDSGRSALNIALASLQIGKGDEIIMPSFTCVVVANAVRWTGAIPIYLDTNKSDFNARYDAFEEKIKEKTKAIVVQHTFGKYVDVDSIRERLKEMGREDIFILEDFAHTIHQNMDLKGDIGFMTFGIEKVISAVRGGAIVTNNEVFAQRCKEKVSELPNFPKKQVAVSLLNPIFWWIAIPLHSVGFGRFTVGAFIRGVWRKLGFLGIMVEEQENRAQKPPWFPAQLPDALASLGMKQLSKLDMYNEHRKSISKIYHEVLAPYSDELKFNDSRVYLRYPIVLSSREEWLRVWNKSRAERVTLGNWFSKPLYGAGVNDDTYKALCYVPAGTPETLKKASLVLNLPTSVNMSKKRAHELVKSLKEVL